MRSGFRLFCLGLAVLPFWCGGAVAAETLALSSADIFPGSTPEDGGYEDLILKEALARMGFALEIVHLPSERALTNANEGIEDGNYSRVAGLERLYPNLVRVPEAIMAFEFAVFAKDPTLKIDGWRSLAAYHVGIVTGWKILEANVVGTRSLSRVGTPQALFEMLALDRVDVVVFDRAQGLALLAAGRHREGIRPLEPPLARQEMFLYLNRRHAALVPRLAEVLREMKHDGTFGSLVRSVTGSAP